MLEGQLSKNIAVIMHTMRGVYRFLDSFHSKASMYEFFKATIHPTIGPSNVRIATRTF
eukprot:jgi/Botrbrau1/19995/Bobra.200_1s0005.1